MLAYSPVTDLLCCSMHPQFTGHLTSPRQHWLLQILAHHFKKFSNAKSKNHNNGIKCIPRISRKVAWRFEQFSNRLYFNKMMLIGDCFEKFCPQLMHWEHTADIIQSNMFGLPGLNCQRNQRRQLEVKYSVIRQHGLRRPIVCEIAKNKDYFCLDISDDWMKYNLGWDIFYSSYLDI